MKVTKLLEVLLICVLIAFVSSKSVQPAAKNATARMENITKPTVVMREVTVDPASVQVVPDLVDSVEVASNAISQSDSNEILDPVVEDVIAAKPSASGDASNAAAPADASATNEVDKPVNNDDPNPINKYCACSEAQCKCCRDFSIPLIPVRGPGCATIRYLDNDKLGVTIKYGDFVLASRQIDSRRSTPICVPLPGGYNRFCGRVYGISRENENFKACLGLELRADDEVEASLRVSCFQFGPRGLATMEAEPLPSLSAEDDDDEDDDDDFLGLGGIAGDDEDDEDDEEPAPSGAAGLVSTVLSGLGAGGSGDDDDDGFAGFSLLGSATDFIGGLFGSDSNKKKKPAEGITINRRNDVKEKKKKSTDLKKKPSISKMDEDMPELDESTTELVEKLADYTQTKSEESEDESTDDSILSVVEAAIDELSDDDSDKSAEKKKAEKKAPAKKTEPEESDDDEDDEDDDYDDYDDEEPTKKPNKNEVADANAEQKISKKKKVKSSYGFGFLGRFLNFFNYK